MKRFDSIAEIWWYGAFNVSVKHRKNISPECEGTRREPDGGSEKEKSYCKGLGLLLHHNPEDVIGSRFSGALGTHTANLDGVVARPE